MFVKKAVVEEGISPCSETGKTCTTIVNGEPCLTKAAKVIKDLPEIDISDKEIKDSK
jgi:hypothetical protein